MTKALWMLAMLFGLALPGCHLIHGERGDEEEVSLDQVPDNVMAAARAALPNFKIEKAEKETEGGKVLYNLAGSSNGKQYEVEVSAAGEVIEIEADGEDDGEDDDSTDEDGDEHGGGEHD